jgi:hypothetical protein
MAYGDYTKLKVGDIFNTKTLTASDFNYQINHRMDCRRSNHSSDPLGPENVFIIGTGPTSGTVGLGNGRFTVSAKSPLTGILGDASGGGHFGAEVKFAGYDGIIVQGASKKPVYLWIDDESVQTMDASHIWGKTTWEAEEIIRTDLGDQLIRVSAIGPGGEKLVRTGCLINDHFRAAGRTGLGAVAGSKNLKAVAVRGTKDVNVANMDGFKEFVVDEEIPEGVLLHLQALRFCQVYINGVPLPVASSRGKNWKQETKISLTGFLKKGGAMGRLSRLAVIPLLFVGIGCAHRIDVTPGLDVLNVSGITKIDKNVGYYISPENLAKEVETLRAVGTK